LAAPIVALLLAQRRDAAVGRAGLDQRLVGVAGGDGFEDVAARGHDLLDAVTGLELEVLHEAEQQRVGHRHGEQVLLEANGNAGTLERDLLGDERDDGGVGRILREVEIREAQLVGERLGDLALGGQIEAHEHRAQAFARPLVLGQRRLQIVVSDQACLNQALTELLSHLSSETLRVRICQQTAIIDIGQMPIKLVCSAKSGSRVQI
jgi:hypothetical protein